MDTFAFPPALSTVFANYVSRLYIINSYWGFLTKFPFIVPWGNKGSF